MTPENKGQFLVYATEDGKLKIDVRLDNETVWLSLDQLATLFGRDKSTISRHIKNVFEEGELLPSATVANFATVQMEGNRRVERDVNYFNLDMIISVGYRVKSAVAKEKSEQEYERFHEQRIRRNDVLDGEFEKSVKTLSPPKPKSNRKKDG